MASRYLPSIMLRSVVETEHARFFLDDEHTRVAVRLSLLVACFFVWLAATIPRYFCMYSGRVPSTKQETITIK